MRPIKCRLFQCTYDATKGYVVFRLGPDDQPADLTLWANVHKEAVFVTRLAAMDYCQYRNWMVDRHGDDRLPDESVTLDATPPDDGTEASEAALAKLRQAVLADPIIHDLLEAAIGVEAHTGKQYKQLAALLKRAAFKITLHNLDPE